MEYDEAHIIQDVLEGKTSRYEYFLDKYGQQVFTLIVRIVASQEDAEELTQDTFLKAFRTYLHSKRKATFRRGYTASLTILQFRPYERKNTTYLTWMIRCLPTFRTNK
jgi:RNA polymerase sigma factor